jgi:hypothetical protein
MRVLRQSRRDVTRDWMHLRSRQPSKGPQQIGAQSNYLHAAQVRCGGRRGRTATSLTWSPLLLHHSARGSAHSVVRMMPGGAPFDFSALQNVLNVSPLTGPPPCRQSLHDCALYGQVAADGIDKDLIHCILASEAAAKPYCVVPAHHCTGACSNQLSVPDHRPAASTSCRPQDPAIKQMAEQIATDPAFQGLTQQLQEGMSGMLGGAAPGAGADAAPAMPDPSNLDPTKYMQAMSGMFSNPQFMQMAEKLGQAIISSDPGMQRMMETMQDPEYKAKARKHMHAHACRDYAIAGWPTRESTSAADWAAPNSRTTSPQSPPMWCSVLTPCCNCVCY